MLRENVNQFNTKYQETCDEVKELKEKVKWNESLIKTREIIWNGIFQQIWAVWEHMNVIAEEKVMIKAFESIIYTNKNHSQEGAQLVIWIGSLYFFSIHLNAFGVEKVEGSTHTNIFFTSRNQFGETQSETFQEGFEASNDVFWG